jgi:aldehyde dehydrogenase (NAD+)
MFGQTTTSELPNKFCMTVRSPIGICSLITPWNFPMAIPSWKVMPALACGNTVVMKPATDTPLSMYNLVRTLEDAGIPRGVVNYVTGGGGEVGDRLMTHPDVKVVSFTGSTAVGRTVSEACSHNFKHCCLEMGGKNCIIVMEDANLELAVDGAIWGGFGTTGQRCTAASRVTAHKAIYKEFMERFVARARALKVGNGLDPTVQMGPVINESQLKTVEEYVQIGKNEGAKLLCGGARLTGGEYDCGWFHAPTIFGDCDPKMRVAQEEIFGPVVSVLPCASLEQAIEINNGVVYGLSSSIYTRNVNRAFQAVRELDTGIVYVNAPTIGAETHLPFGGTKQTGNGHREAAVTALDFYSEWKTVYVDYSDRLQRAQIDS